MSMKLSPSTHLMTCGASCATTSLAQKARCRTAHLSEIGKTCICCSMKHPCKALVCFRSECCTRKYWSLQIHRMVNINLGIHISVVIWNILLSITGCYMITKSLFDHEHYKNDDPLF